MKYLWLTFLVITISSCGSFTTVPKSNGEISSNLKRHDSNCESIPRIYSGVSYDFCRFNAKPKEYSNNLFMTGFILDIALFSPIMDTVLLPVTIYQQVKHGSVEVKN